MSHGIFYYREGRSQTSPGILFDIMTSLLWCIRHHPFRCGRPGSRARR
ncbi:hypothetical protein LEMLEM_LOCUS19107 [Lemmus lemmus]